MKRIFVLLAIVFFGMDAMAQTVENIRVDQEGENILVHYRIGGSTESQTFYVTLTCSIDGGRPFEPKTTIGDVGGNIRGGKSNYTITWDVFEDLDEIGEVEFFVKVDLTSGPSEAKPVKKEEAETISEKGSSDLIYFLAYTGSTLSPYGGSTGLTFNKWGGYLSFRLGVDDYIYDYTDWRTYIAGIIRQITEKGKYKLYAYVGAGVINEYYEDYTTDYYDSYTSLLIDAGIINTYGRVSLTLGVEYSNLWWTQGVFGVGYMFPIKRREK